MLTVMNGLPIVRGWLKLHPWTVDTISTTISLFDSYAVMISLSYLKKILGPKIIDLLINDKGIHLGEPLYS